jgi:uncharacterized protein YdgA (DUF945 family)
MERNMKKIIGLVVIAAALVLGSIYGMGLVTERTLKRSIDIVNQSTGISVDVVEYHRRLLESSAVMDVKIHLPERFETNADGKMETIPAQNYTLNVPVKINHGPIIYSGSNILFGFGYAQSTLTLPKELVEKFSSHFTEQSTQPQLQLSVFVNYANQSQFQVEVPAFKLVFKEGEGDAKWMGMKGDINISADLKKFNGAFTLTGLEVVKEKMKMVVGTATNDYALQKTDDGLYLGQAGVVFSGVKITQDEKPLFDLTEFKARNESKITNDLFESSFKTSFEKVLSETKQYGPGLLEMSIKNLDAKVLALLNSQANKLKTSTGTERQQLMFAMLPELPKLFAKGASFEVSTLKLKVPEGDIEGHVAISLPKSDTVNAFQIMQKVQGDGKLQIPSALVRQLLIDSLVHKALAESSLQSKVMTQMAPDSVIPDVKDASSTVSTDQSNASSSSTDSVTQQATSEADKKLAALVEAKLLIVQGQDYVIEVNLSEGKLTVNGQPFDPSTFKI